MVQVLDDLSMQCVSCVKRDVCKFQEEYEQTFLNIKDDFRYPTEIFEVKLKCKKYVGHVVTYADNFPGSNWNGTGGTMLLRDAITVTSDNKGVLS